MKKFLLVAFALCTLPQSAEAFSWSRSYQGVVATCTAENISVSPGPHREYDIRGGKGGEITLFVTEQGREYRYVITGESRQVPPRNLGVKKSNFTVRAWVFTCTIASAERAAHTCNKLSSSAGSCVVCHESEGKDRCKRLTFSIKRLSTNALPVSGRASLCECLMRDALR
jgi:hypothetical protein